MTSLLLILSFFGNGSNVPTSDSTPLRSRIYLVDIYKYESGASKAYLYGVTDTSLQLTRREQLYGHSYFDATVPYGVIEHISVNRKGAARSALLTGVLLGTGVGAIAGLAFNKSCTDCVIDHGVGLSMIKGISVGLPLGAAIGYLLGRRRHTFDISRKRENFDAMRTKLLRYYSDKTLRVR